MFIRVSGVRLSLCTERDFSCKVAEVEGPSVGSNRIVDCRNLPFCFIGIQAKCDRLDIFEAVLLRKRTIGIRLGWQALSLQPKIVLSAYFRKQASEITRV